MVIAPPRRFFAVMFTFWNGFHFSGLSHEKSARPTLRHHQRSTRFGAQFAVSSPIAADFHFDERQSLEEADFLVSAHLCGLAGCQDWELRAIQHRLSDGLCCG